MEMNSIYASHGLLARILPTTWRCLVLPERTVAKLEKEMILLLILHYQKLFQCFQQGHQSFM